MHLEFVVNYYQYNIFQLYKYEITSQTAEVTNQIKKWFQKPN